MGGIIIHACDPYWDNISICGKGYVWADRGHRAWAEGHGGVDFSEHRKLINCPVCAADVSCRMDGTPLSEIKLRSRPRNCLERDKIYTIEYVESMSDGELMRLPNFGKGSLREVRNALKMWKKKQRDYGEWDYHSFYSVE